MIRKRLVLVVAAGAVAFGGGAAFAATHGAAHPAERPAKAAPVLASNVHYPCRHHGTPQAQL